MAAFDHAEQQPRTALQYATETNASTGASLPVDVCLCLAEDAYASPAVSTQSEQAIQLPVIHAFSLATSQLVRVICIQVYVYNITVCNQDSTTVHMISSSLIALVPGP